VAELERQVAAHQDERGRTLEQVARLQGRNKDLERQLAERGGRSSPSADREEIRRLHEHLEVTLQQAERAVEERDALRQRLKEEVSSSRSQAKDSQLRLQLPSSPSWGEAKGALGSGDGRAVGSAAGLLNPLRSSSGSATAVQSPGLRSLDGGAAGLASPLHSPSWTDALAPVGSGSERLRSPGLELTSTPSLSSPGRPASPSGLGGRLAAAATSASDFSPEAALPEGYLEVLREIERSGWDAMEWEKGFTLLHWAAKNGCPQLCQQLLSHGASPWALDDAQHSALEYARERSCSRTVAILEAGSSGALSGRNSPRGLRAF